MTLSYHTLSGAAYEDLRYEHIKVSEGESLLAYLDSKGIATIGVGFNLRDEDVRDEVLKAFGFDLTSAADRAYGDQIAAEVGRSWTNDAALRVALDRIMLDRANDSGGSDDKRDSFEFSSAAEMKAVFNAVVLSGIPDSKERAALVSLAYNNPGKLLGSNLRAAIEAGDRAEGDLLIRLDATCVGLDVFTPGGVISPGQPILHIVPSDGEHIVEAQLRPEDIDRVTAGQAAVVRFPAFNARTTPSVGGSVRLRRPAHRQDHRRALLPGEDPHSRKRARPPRRPGAHLGDAGGDLHRRRRTHRAHLPAQALPRRADERHQGRVGRLPSGRAADTVP